MTKSHLPRKRGEEISYDGKTFRTYKELADHYGKGATIVRRYYLRGRLDELLAGVNGNKLVTAWRDYRFESQSAAARAIGVSPSTVHLHLANYTTIDHLYARWGSPLWKRARGRLNKPIDGELT